MTLPAADHPIWKIIRLVIVGIVMFGIFYSKIVYKSDIELKDYFTIFFTLCALAGFDVGKAKLCSSKEAGQ